MAGRDAPAMRQRKRSVEWARLTATAGGESLRASTLEADAPSAASWQEFRGGRVRGNPRRRGCGRLMAVARQPAQEG